MTELYPEKTTNRFQNSCFIILSNGFNYMHIKENLKFIQWLKIHETITVEVKGTFVDDPHSELALTNMTAQMLAQLQFLEENEYTKKSELERIRMLYGNAGLINFKDEEAKRVSGIDTVGRHIKEKKEEICELQKKGFIYQIVFDC